MARYEIELWTNSGRFIADVSRLCTGRRFSLQRNEAETFECEVDGDELERFARKIGEHSRYLLMPYQMNLRIKRDGEYLFGAQIMDSPPDDAPDKYAISLAAEGYLNLLNKRYVTQTFTATETTSIATGIIDYVQGVPGGDMGITINPVQYATGVLRDRTFEREEAKNKLQRLTNLRDGRFDFAFSADKVFGTYQSLGAVRDDLSLVLGRNVKHAGFTQILPSNRIHGLGSGFGQDQLISSDDVSNDTASQAVYYMRERIAQFNSVDVQETLDENTQAVLDYYKDLRSIPVVHITGNELPGTFLSVGDRFPLDLTARQYMDHVLGWYRLERIEVSLDDNGFEDDIALYFDNQYIDPETGDDA